MKNRSVSLKKLTPAQLLVVLILVAGISFFQYFRQSTGNKGVEVAPASSPGDSNPGPVGQAEDSFSTPTAIPTLGLSESEKATGNFDYFVLVLSWSPDYCSTNGNNDPQQCSIGKKLGFVLHGLWPQYNKGYPSNCSGDQLQEGMKDQFPALFPNDELYNHEWEKHGTCTGLKPASYLSLAKKLKDSVNLPAVFQSPNSPFRVSRDKLKDEFISANPDFSRSSIAVYCSDTGRFS